MPDPRKVALLEIDGSHEECLYSQMLFLREGGFEVTLVCNDKLRERVAWYSGLAHETRFFHLDGISAWQELKALWRLRQFLVSANVGQIVLNTAHGSRIRNFLQFPFPPQIRFHGVMHGINKLHGSMSQKLIGRKLDTYFVLNDYLLDNLPKRLHRRKHFAGMYAAWFPDISSELMPAKPEGACWIAIPGAIEYKRRNYGTLVEALAASKPDRRLKFLLLGDGNHPHGNGKELRALIGQKGLEDCFFIQDGYMPAPLLHAYLAQSDAVMPLIHPGTPEMDKYVGDQISGSFNLAFAYRKPLLMHSVYRRYADFQENALFYEDGDLASFLTGLPEKLRDSAPGMYRHEKWTLGYQANSYCAALR